MKTTFPDGFTKLYTTFIDRIEMDSKTLSIVVKDNMGLLNQPLLNKEFKGTGGAEGTADWEGQKKQRVFGKHEVSWIPVQFIDPTRLIYFVGENVQDQFNGLNSVGYHVPRGITTLINPSSCNVYEGGIYIHRGGNYGSVDELENEPPSPGTCRWYIGPEGAFFRLGSTPTFELRVSIVNNIVFQVREILKEVAPAEFTKFLNSGLISLLVSDEGFTYADLLTQVAAKTGQYFWQDRFGYIKEGKIFTKGNLVANPVKFLSRKTSKYTFTDNESTSINITPITPHYRVEYSSTQTWPSEPAPAADDSIKEKLRREGFYKVVSYENADILGKHRNAGVKKLECLAEINDETSDPQYTTSLSRILDELVEMYTTERLRIEISIAQGLLDSSLVGIDILDRVTVQMDRFGLSAGRDFAVIGIRPDYKSRLMKFTLWG